MFIDTHAHLDMVEHDEIGAILERAKSEGVGKVITIGTDVASSARAVEIANEYNDVFATCGVHPHDASSYDEAAIRKLVKNKKVCAIGEIGLDFHYDRSPRDCQVDVFKSQLDLACELDMPVVIHCREAGEKLVEILKDYSDLKGVVHCFSENKDIAKWLLLHNYYISYTGTITFKNAKSYLPVVESIPIESVMLETDMPFLAPVPRRGSSNESSFLPHIAKKLADVIGLSFEDVARITTFNARELFKIDVDIEHEEKIVYPIRNSLYLNITNRCTDACVFCVRYYTDTVKGHNLRLTSEPSVDDILKEIARMSEGQEYDEVVFCGYGEPMLRLDMIKSIAKAVKSLTPPLKVRIDTNGHGNTIHGRNILPELVGLIDSLSISLNAESAQQYVDICRPKFGMRSYDDVKSFVLEAKKHVGDVIVTVVALPDVDIEKCRKIAEDELGVSLRVRQYNSVG